MVHRTHAVMKTRLFSACVALALSLPATAVAAPSASPPDEAESPEPGTEPEAAEPGAEAAPDPEPEPEPEPEPAPAPDAASATVDVAKLGQLDDEAKGLQDRLLQARTRVALLTSKLYDAKFQLELRSNLERFYAIRDFTITIDGAPVYHQSEGLGSLDGPIIDLYAAPGSHRVGVSAELVAKRDDKYRVRLDQEYTVVVPESSTVKAKLKLRETGNMFANFDKRNSGRYDFRVRLKVRARPDKDARRKAAANGATSAGGGSATLGGSASSKPAGGGQ